MTRTPRVIYVRHGETEWSKKGFHTSTTELSLTPHGATCASQDGLVAVGDNKIVDPKYVRRVFCSPRVRAQQTMNLFLADKKWQIPEARFSIDERIREWDYGKYEGWTSAQINGWRHAQGKEGSYKIYKEGAEGGESPEDITGRLDSIISEIRELHKEVMENQEECGDVLVFAHGHSLRMFVMRWLGLPLDHYIPMVLPAGGVGVLSYEHHNIDEPALVLGSSFNMPQAN